MKQFLTGLGFSFVLAVGGCATVSENLAQLNQSLTAPNYETLGDTSQSGQGLRQEISDYDKTVRQGMLIGAAAGAVIGGAVANSKEDSDTGDVVAGAVIGGLIGGVVGGLGGKAVADQKAKQIVEEDTLDEEIVAQSERNDRLVRISQAAKTLVAEREVQLAELTREDEAETNRMKALLIDDVRTLDKALDAAASDIEKMQALQVAYKDSEDEARIEKQLLIAENEKTSIETLRAELEALQTGLA